MNLPKTWGAGALFANENAADDLSHALWGTLCGDVLGINFQLTTPCTLYLDVRGAIKTNFSCVMPDFISGTVSAESGDISFCIAAVSARVVVVHTEPSVPVRLCIHGDAKCETTEEKQIYSCGNDVFYLSRSADGRTCVFSADDCGANEYFSANLENDFMQKHSAENLPEIQSEFEPLYRKCMAVVRTNIFLHKGKKIFGEYACGFRANSADVLLRSVALKGVFKQCAADTCLTVANSIRADGSVPCELTTDTGTAPPLIAWAFDRIFGHDVQAINQYYDSLRKTVMYYINSRDIDKNNLYQWTSGGAVDSGKINSPRFDGSVIISGVDLSAYMYMSVTAMRRMAELINRNSDILYWGVMAERIKTAATDFLYDMGFYYDREIVRHKQIKLKTSDGFMPLFAQMCTPSQTAALIKHMNNKEEFGAAYGVPSVARNEKSYCADMHRGPIWLNDNFKIAYGLKKSERNDEAEKLVSKCLEAVRRALVRDGVIYEFYSPSSCADNCLLTANGCGGSPHALFAASANHRDNASAAAMTLGMVNLFI